MTEKIWVNRVNGRRVREVSRKDGYVLVEALNGRTGPLSVNMTETWLEEAYTPLDDGGVHEGESWTLDEHYLVKIRAVANGFVVYEHEETPYVLSLDSFVERAQPGDQTPKTIPPDMLPDRKIVNIYFRVGRDDKQGEVLLSHTGDIVPPNRTYVLVPLDWSKAKRVNR